MVRLRVRFEWTIDGSATKRGQGISRDISTCGVYFTTRTPLALDARVQLEIEIPSFVNRHHTIHLRGEGAVVRVERIGCRAVNPRLGIAAAVHFYQETSRQILLCLASEQSPAASVSQAGGRNSTQGAAVGPRGPARTPVTTMFQIDRPE